MIKKLVCISNVDDSGRYISDITINKVYNMYPSVATKNIAIPSGCFIMDDRRVMRWLLNDLFVDLDDYRERQLNMIL